MFRALVFVMIAVAVALAGDRPLQSQATAPDLLIVNARVYTVDRAFSIAEGLAVTSGRFTAVGSTAQLRRLAGPSTKILDLGGTTVIPGLQDDHLHSAGGGPGVDLSRARTLASVLSLIAARVKESKPGDIVTTNADWHEAQLKEHRLTFRAALDTVAQNTRVVVVRGGHEYILNSAALKKWGIDRETLQPQGGRISRDANGALNGELMDRAKELVKLPQAGAERLSIDSLIAEHKKLNASGLTSIRYPGASIEQFRILQEMEKKGLLTIRVNQLMRAFDATDATRMRAAVAAWNVKQDEGDEWVRIGGIKLAVDGGFEGGWMTKLYAKPYDEGGRFYGVNTIKQAPYTDIVKELNRQGWRVAKHAGGDAAIDEVLA